MTEREIRIVKLVCKLAPREIQVLTMIGDGKGTKAMARELGTSVKTIESQRRTMCGKLGENEIAALVRIAILSGLSEL